MKLHSKRYKESEKLLDRNKVYVIYEKLERVSLWI